MTNRKTFLDPEAGPVIGKVASFIDELRPLQGERLADVEKALADMVARDPIESDRRLRIELVRTVAYSQPPQLKGGVDPEELRRTLFAAVWDAHTTGGREGDLFSMDRETLLESIASRFEIDPADIGDALFADTPAERRLFFPSGERETVAREAIRTVNLERLRAGLRDAVGLSLQFPARSTGGTDYVRLLWDARRFGLMYDASQAGNSITMDLSGPYTLFAKTTMYGNRLFEFTRQVLEYAGGEWKLRVDLLVREKGGKTNIRNFWLDASLRSFFVAIDRDPVMSVRSGDEEAFQKYFLKLSSAWRLQYEGALVPLQGKGRTFVMVPDFVARLPHSSIEVLIEIVGFWKAEYLQKKMEKVRLLGNRRLMLIVNSKLSVTREELLVPENDLVRAYFYAGRAELKLVAELVAKELESIASGHINRDA